MRSLRLSRRALVGSLGVAAASSFLPSLDRKGLAAQAPAKRLVIIYSGHGTFYPNWQMRAGAPVSTSDSPMDWQMRIGPAAQADFSRVLAPLYDLRNDLTVYDGLGADLSGDRNHWGICNSG